MSIRDQVLEFHRTFAVPVRNTPGVLSDERVRLRLRLIAEEFFELLEACLEGNEHIPMHPRETINSNGVRVIVGNLITSSRVNVMLPDVADALADIAYVVEGANLEFGVNSEAVLAEVHAANMRKVGGGQRADGKICKPDGWQAPDIVGELRRQGWVG